MPGYSLLYACDGPGCTLNGRLDFLGQLAQGDFTPGVELVAKGLERDKCFNGIVRHLGLAADMGAAFAFLGLDGPFQPTGTPAVANGLLGKGVTTFTILDTQEYQPMAAGEGEVRAIVQLHTGLLPARECIRQPDDAFSWRCRCWC